MIFSYVHSESISSALTKGVCIRAIPPSVDRIVYNNDMEKITPRRFAIIQITSADQITPKMKTSLVELLADSVAHNYSVGFMNDSTPQDYEEFWQQEFSKTKSSNGIFLAVEGEQVLGSVIVTRESRANGKHRGEFRKLLVHSLAQKIGIGSALERAATEYARSIGLSLLFLDSATNFLVEGVFEQWGWKMSGEIPQYAKNPDGELVSTWFFYKLLNTEK